MKRGEMKRGYLCFFISIAIVMIAVILDFSKKVRGTTPPVVKRGYILDRRGEPLVISLENYKAYYLLKKGRFFREKIPAPVRKYLPRTLNLPDEGLILLSENLSPEEFEELKGIKNVILQRYYKRKLLYPYLEPFVGKCFNNIGISGVEKEFNEILKTGRILKLSLDLRLEKKLYSIVKGLPVPYEIAVFDLKTGEVLGFLATSPFGFRYDRLWKLVKEVFAKLCGEGNFPTLLYQSKKVCSPELSKIKHNPGWYDLGEIVCWLKIKRDRLYLLALKVKGDKKQLKTLGQNFITAL